MLSVEDVGAGYGDALALAGVSLEVAAGEVVVVLGRNGAGKSTLLKVVMGLVAQTAGTIRFRGRSLGHLPPHARARLGLGYVPEDRRIFAGLTVAENLAVGRQPPRPGHDPWTTDRLLALFPNLEGLAGRRGNGISGGEQQMLAIARTLMGNPLCVLLDEPATGLAPRIQEALTAAVRTMAGDGLGLLVAEQNLAFARAVADRVFVLENGRGRWQGTFADPAASAVFESALGVGVS